MQITLTPLEEGTLLSVEHRDLPAEQAPQHAIGWPHFLNRLASRNRPESGTGSLRHAVSRYWGE